MMKYYKYSDNIHVFEALPSEGNLVAHKESTLSKVEDINHDWHETRADWNKICAINCSFFNNDGSRNGCSMNDGTWIFKPYPTNVWVSMLWNGVNLNTSTSINIRDYEGSTIVKGVLPLMYEGTIDKRRSQVSDFAPRTFIGQKEDKTLVMVVTDGRPFGLSFEDTFKVARDLGCYNAVMLDGGGSSTMCINNEMVNDNENRKVFDSLIFYSKEELQMSEPRKSVCLDAGHGMYTNGKQTPAYPNGTVIKEAEQNYPIMFKVAEKLTNSGIDVFYTNTNIDKDMPLETRVEIANQTGADLFYSFHKNAGPTYEWTNIRGVEHLIYGRGGQAEKAANIIHKKVIESCGDKDRGVKVQNVYVLRKTSMPAVLGELGFMTSKEDAQDMLSDQAQECYATAIAKGICEYFGVEYKPLDEAPIEECVDEAKKNNLIVLHEQYMLDVERLSDARIALDMEYDRKFKELMQ